MPTTIRPVSYEQKIGTFRVVTDARGIGAALLAHCDPADPTYQAAAASCLALDSSEADPEQARADFVAAMKAAGVYVREP